MNIFDNLKSLLCRIWSEFYRIRAGFLELGHYGKVCYQNCENKKEGFSNYLNYSYTRVFITFVQGTEPRIRFFLAKNLTRNPISRGKDLIDAILAEGEIQQVNNISVSGSRLINHDPCTRIWKYTIVPDVYIKFGQRCFFLLAHR